MMRSTRRRPKNEGLAALVAVVAMYIVIYGLQMLAWIGAEWQFLRNVTICVIDHFVNAILAYFVTRQFIDWANQLAQARRRNEAGGGYYERRQQQQP